MDVSSEFNDLWINMGNFGISCKCRNLLGLTVLIVAYNSFGPREHFNLECVVEIMVCLLQKSQNKNLLSQKRLPYLQHNYR